MNTMKTLVALSVSSAGLFGAANAATVGTFGTVSITGTLVDNLPNTIGGGPRVSGTFAGSGTAILDDVGTLVVTDRTVATTTVGGNPATTFTTTNTSAFTGTYASSVFAGTGGTSTTTSCVPAGTGCSIQLALSTGAYLSMAGTVAVPAGGSLVTAIAEFDGNDTATETWTFSGFTPASSVPLPPALWLLGSGLAGLAGTARRRRSPKA